MSWTTYATFAAFATLVVLAPGPDTLVVLKNSLVGGRAAGMATSLGICASNTVQGTAAAFGVGALIVRSQPLFEAIRWAGVAYLCFLGFQALRSAWRGEYARLDTTDANPRRHPFTHWRQGFVSNITNPKVLAFYLSVLPQFLHPGETGALDALALAYTHAVIGIGWLLVLVWLLHRMRTLVSRRRVRRTLDALAGTALVGFAVRLATEPR
jgi:threonine/homoserine/homoserine lactone efflux protein